MIQSWAWSLRQSQVSPWNKHCDFVASYWVWYKNYSWEVITWAVQKMPPDGQRGRLHPLHLLKWHIQWLSPLHNVCGGDKTQSFGETKVLVPLPPPHVASSFPSKTHFGCGCALCVSLLPCFVRLFGAVGMTWHDVGFAAAGLHLKQSFGVPFVSPWHPRHLSLIGVREHVCPTSPSSPSAFLHLPGVSTDPEEESPGPWSEQPVLSLAAQGDAKLLKLFMGQKIPVCVHKRSNCSPHQTPFQALFLAIMPHSFSLFSPVITNLSFLYLLEWAVLHLKTCLCFSCFVFVLVVFFGWEIAFSLWTMLLHTTC